jgi:transcriptional regulator with PAS, ATPase and Fis domain
MDDFNTDIESFYVDDHTSTSAAQGMRLTRCVTTNEEPLDLREREDVEILAAHLLRTLPDEGIDLRAAVDEFESHLIRQALAKTGGNKNKAAQLLRLNRTTLVEMVKRKRLNVA